MDIRSSNLLVIFPDPGSRARKRIPVAVTALLLTGRIHNKLPIHRESEERGNEVVIRVFYSQSRPSGGE